MRSIEEIEFAFYTKNQRYSLKFSREQVPGENSQPFGREEDNNNATKQPDLNEWLGIIQKSFWHRTETILPAGVEIDHFTAQVGILNIHTKQGIFQYTFSGVEFPEKLNKMIKKLIELKC